MSLKPRVTVATVTYGERATTCIRVVERALATGAADAVVIDNGSAPESAKALWLWAEGRAEITLVRLARNEGSASGFAAALEAAAARDTPWVWLLDDDNLPTHAALEAALAVAGEPGAKTVVACFRTADDMQAAVLGGARVEDTLDVRGSFVGFDLGHRLRGAPVRRAHEPVGSVEIPWAPYGGLLLPSAAIREVGLPRRSFVLYGDDRDYSERLRAAGYRILLSRDAAIDDLTARWSPGDSPQAESGGHLAAMIRSGDTRRAYYLVRNAVFDDRRRARREHAQVRLALNGAVFLAFTAVQAIRNGRPRFFLLIVKAAARGASGRWYSTSSR